MAQPPLSYRREGKGPALLMFHGGVGSRNHWERNIPELSRHFTVTAVDLPGFGASADVPPDIGAYLSLVTDAAAALGGDRFGLADSRSAPSSALRWHAVSVARSSFSA